MINESAYVRVSPVVVGWHRSATAAAAAISAARPAMAGHAADIQHKRITHNFAFVNRGTF